MSDLLDKNRGEYFYNHAEEAEKKGKPLNKMGNPETWRKNLIDLSK